MSKKCERLLEVNATTFRDAVFLALSKIPSEGIHVLVENKHYIFNIKEYNENSKEK